MALSSSTAAPKEDPVFEAAKKGEWANTRNLCLVKIREEKVVTRTIRRANPRKGGFSGMHHGGPSYRQITSRSIIPAQYDYAPEKIKNAVEGAIAGNFFSSAEQTKITLQNILNTSGMFYVTFCDYLKKHLDNKSANDILKSIDEFSKALEEKAAFARESEAFVRKLKRYSGSFWIYHRNRALSFLSACQNKSKTELSSMIQKQLSFFNTGGVGPSGGPSGTAPNGDEISEKKHEQPLKNQKQKDEFYTLLETYSHKFK